MTSELKKAKKRPVEGWQRNEYGSGVQFLRWLRVGGCWLRLIEAEVRPTLHHPPRYSYTVAGPDMAPAQDKPTINVIAGHAVTEAQAMQAAEVIMRLLGQG